MMAKKKVDPKKAPPKKTVKKKKTEKHPGGAPSLYDNKEDLEKAINLYFESCDPKPVTSEGEDGIICLTDKHGDPVYTQPFPPTTARLAHYLGYLSRQSLHDLKKKEEFSYLIKRAILFCEGYHEGRLGMNERNSGSIFWLKNHGWTDKQELEVSGDKPQITVYQLPNNGREPQPDVDGTD